MVGYSRSFRKLFSERRPVYFEHVADHGNTGIPKSSTVPLLKLHLLIYFPFIVEFRVLYG